MVGIDTAINNTLSGIQSNQQAISIISQNIANANSEGYTRREVNQSTVIVGGTVSGTQIDEITRSVDEFLNVSARRQNSPVGRSETLVSFFNRVELLYGAPGAENSLGDKVQNFFNALSDFADRPEENSTRSNALNNAELLANSVANLAQDLEDLRFDVDQEITQTINNLNNLLSRAKVNNDSLRNVSQLGGDASGLLDERDAIVNEITQILDVQVTFNANGTTNIAVDSGELLSEIDVHTIKYTPVTSVQSLIDGDAINAITAVRLNASGAETNNQFTLKSSSDASSTISNFDSGILQGLIDLRDTELPNLLTQLDNFATVLADSFNAIHNDGSGFPPASSLTGTRQVSLNDEHAFTGSFMVAVLDDDGTPVLDEFLTDGKPPLTIDFSRLSGPSGEGFARMRDIITEINAYYGPPPARVIDMGPLSDIRLASLDQTVSNGGTLELDIEASNFTGDAATIQITSATASDGVTVSGDGTFVATTIASGARQRTGLEANSNDTITLDFGATTANPGDTITVDVTVDIVDVDGTTTTDTITFNVTYPLSTDDVQNNRFTASSISGAGDATSTTPSDNTGFIRADLVDADGDAITSINESGVLKLTGLGTDQAIVLDELTSAEAGRVSFPTAEATGFGVGHFFGLNDFFETGTTGSNTALNFAIRSEYLTNPSLLATGALNQSLQPTDATADPIFTFELSVGDNQLATRLANLSRDRQDFDAAAGIGAVNLTILEYAGEIISFQANRAVTLDDERDQNVSLLEAFTDQIDTVSGVNIDEELANSVIFQNNFAATARMINVLSELFDDLINAF